MARFDRDGEPEDEEVTQVKTQLVGAEKNFQKMMDRRNSLGDQSRERRAERDAINEQKRHMVAEIRRLQADRDQLNGVSREHRDKRNEFQRQAKELIEIKKRMRASEPPERKSRGEDAPRGDRRRGGGAGGGGSTAKGYAGKVRELETEIKLLEYQQQTTAMPIAKENALLKKLTELRKELEIARVQYSGEAKILADVKDIDAKIDEFFKAADAEHALVVEHGDKAHAIHNQIEPMVKELRFLDQQSDQKHQQHLELRAQADAVHAEMNEARDKVIGLRDAKTGIFRERRQIIADQNQSVRAALYDQDKLDAAADEAVKLLLSKKKVEL